MRGALPGVPGQTSTESDQQAQQVEDEGRQRAETLRQEGMARARSIITNAEREAQAVIEVAKEAAAEAESQARLRSQAILAGRPLPELPPSSSEGKAPAPSATPGAKISALPADGSMLRFRIAGPMSFAAMLQLKREVARLRGVDSITVLPAEGGDAVLSLQANDSGDVLSRLRSLPSLAPRANGAR